jgi:hypothetical protein
VVGVLCWCGVAERADRVAPQDGATEPLVRGTVSALGAVASALLGCLLAVVAAATVGEVGAVSGGADTHGAAHAARLVLCGDRRVLASTLSASLSRYTGRPCSVPAATRCPRWTQDRSNCRLTWHALAHIAAGRHTSRSTRTPRKLGSVNRSRAVKRIVTRGASATNATRRRGHAARAVAVLGD